MQVMSNGRVRRTDAEWRELLGRWKKSGLSAREFCRQEEVQVSSFHRWDQRLRGSAGSRDFVAVTPAPTAPAAGPRWSLEVILPDNIRLRFQG
jgi:hypothetical protein